MQVRAKQLAAEVMAAGEPAEILTAHNEHAHLIGFMEWMKLQSELKIRKE